ncbi:MAG: helix-turn-helix domain-containing protein [Ruminococcus sp.]|nr:helix-turn-helix domain-containing protein [Ruminococcus sp.]
MYDFGMRLQQLRLSHNMSQEALGKKLNRSKSVICTYENNLRIPPLEVLTDIAVLFNVSLDYLVGIDKLEMVSVDGLDNEQKEIIHRLIHEFKAPKSKFPGLTESQQDLLNKVLIELNKKHQ